MKGYEILMMAILVIWIVSMPYLRKFKLYQFGMLLAVAFGLGIMITGSVQSKGWEPRSVLLFVMLTGGLIYQSYKFYRTNLSDRT